MRKAGVTSLLICSSSQRRRRAAAAYGSLGSGWLQTALLQKPGQVALVVARRVMSIFVREAFHATMLIARCAAPMRWASKIATAGPMLPVPSMVSTSLLGVFTMLICSQDAEL